MRRIRRTPWTVLAALCCAVLFSAVAQAQQYRFAVPKVRVVLTVQPDASVLIDYRINFVNNAGAHPIDIVDVGMPTRDYEVQSAAIDGRPLSSWKASTEIETGPEIHLEGNAIPPGGSGTFECRARVTGMVYADRDDKARASLRFSPTWFGEKYVSGETDLHLIVKFPPGVHSDDVVWHSGMPKFFEKGALDPDNVASVAWKDHYRFTGPRMFGCSFPRSVMTRVETAGLWTMFWFWWQGSAQAQEIGGAIFLILFSVCFLLVTRGTGITVLFICVAVSVVVMLESPKLHLCLWSVIPIMAAAWYFAIHRRRPHYLPAVAQVEGGGVCRGLTPAEAAVLLELPSQRVLGLVLTGLFGKGVIRVVKPDLLEVELRGTRPEPNTVSLQGQQTVLEPYEVSFLDVLCAPPPAVPEKNFSAPLKSLVGMVAYKISGFDRAATRDYYRAVAGRAWEQVSAETDPKKKDALAAQRLNWLSMSDDYERRMEAERARGWSYCPAWFYSPSYSHTGNWYRDLTRSVAPAAARSMQGIVSPVKGVNLSGVDHFTLDKLDEIMTSAAESGGGGGGWGGGGGGCACACAGCACACACAGGGR